LHGGERLLARWCPRRDAHQIDLLMKPPRVRDGSVTLIDSFHVGLRLPGKENAQRFVLPRRPRSVELLVDDLPDVGHIVGELLAYWDQRFRYHELRQRQTIGRLDFAAHRLVRGERSFVALAEMDGPFSRDVPRRSDGEPERADDEVVFGGVVLMEVADVDPFAARSTPRERKT